MNALEQPGHQLDEYRFKLAQARRRAIHDRLDDLMSTINAALGQITDSIAWDSSDRVDDPRTKVVEESISEIERLLGDTTDRKGRWGDLHRHLRFSEGHDWHDIAEMDWPSVRADVEAASLSNPTPCRCRRLTSVSLPPRNPQVVQASASTGLSLMMTALNACFLISCGAFPVTRTSSG